MEASRRRSVDRDGEGSHTQRPWRPTKPTRRLPMEVMIAHPLVLPDEAQSLGDLEAAVRGWGLAVQQQALAEAWARQAAHRPVGPCPTCGHAATPAAGTKRRRVETVFGPVWLCRQRRRCSACGGHF